MTDASLPAAGSVAIPLSRRTHERAGERRTDPDWLDVAWADPATRVLPLAGRRLPVSEDGTVLLWRSPAEASAATRDGERIFLGIRAGVAHFALTGASEQDGQRWRSPRGVVQTMNPEDAGLMVHAVALAEWLATYRHCPCCGARLRVASAGHVLRCQECGRQQFPRTDPAVIMLVTDGERALLGRQDSWPPGRYSTLAGFVDPGESLEEAVIREVAEETSVRVGTVTYFGNQPWPFPASLMVGFFASAASTEIVVDGNELSDARWFTREELKAGAEEGTLVLPGGVSISRSLVEAWYGDPLPGQW